LPIHQKIPMLNSIDTQ